MTTDRQLDIAWTKLHDAAPDLLEVLRDWERTPGNRRDSNWWHNWEDKRKAALVKAGYKGS